MKCLYVIGESKWMLLLKHRKKKTGTVIVWVKTEIRILTKQIPTGGPISQQTAFTTIYLEEVIIALETSVKIVMMQASIMMDIGVWYPDGPHQDMDRYGGWDHYITMMSEAAEITTEALIPG